MCGRAAVVERSRIGNGVRISSAAQLARAANGERARRDRDGAAVGVNAVQAEDAGIIFGQRRRATDDASNVDQIGSRPAGTE